MHKPHVMIFQQKVKVTILTPVHIGRGEKWRLNWNVIVDKENNTSYVADLDDVLRALSLKELQNFANANTSNQIRHQIQQNGRKIPYRLYGDEFSPHIRTGCQIPYLPGSSIKGALRSVLLWKSIYTDPQLSDQRKHINDGQINNQILGIFENALTRIFQIPDMHFPEYHQKTSTEWWNTKVLGAPINDGNYGWKNRREGGYCHDFQPNAFVHGIEVLSRDQSMIALWRASLPSRWSQVANTLSQKLNNLGINLNTSRKFWSSIFSILNEWIIRHIKREIQFFNRYNEFEYYETVKKIYDNIQKEVPPVKGDNSYAIMRVGFGGGFHAITGDWQYDNHMPLNHPRGNGVWLKTRKLAFRKAHSQYNNPYEFQPLGFIKVEMIDDNKPITPIHCSGSDNRGATNQKSITSDPPSQRSSFISLPTRSGMKSMAQYEGKELKIQGGRPERIYKVRIPIRDRSGEIREIIVQLTGVRHEPVEGEQFRVEITEVNQQGEPTRCRRV